MQLFSQKPVRFFAFIQVNVGLYEYYDPKKVSNFNPTSEETMSLGITIDTEIDTENSQYTSETNNLKLNLEVTPESIRLPLVLEVDDLYG